MLVQVGMGKNRTPKKERDLLELPDIGSDMLGGCAHVTFMTAMFIDKSPDQLSCLLKVSTHTLSVYISWHHKEDI